MADRPTGRSLGLLVIFAIAAYLCWLMLRPFVGVLMWAIVLVVVFYPAHRRLVPGPVVPAPRRRFRRCWSSSPSCSRWSA